MAAPWRTAHALDTMLAETNQRWPDRSKTSDGTIGDAAHQTRDSDHNPWVKVDGVGVVRARDTTAKGIDVDAFAEHMRQLGKAGDPRLNGGGYVISRRRIASEVGDWAWREYKGSNPHEKHCHVSLSRNRAGFDSRASWGINQIGRPKPPPPDPNKGRVWRQFSNGATDASIYNKPTLPGKDNEVSELQVLLATLGHLRMNQVDGTYGPVTLSAVIAAKDKLGWRNRTSVIDQAFITKLREAAK